MCRVFMTFGCQIVNLNYVGLSSNNHYKNKLQFALAPALHLTTLSWCSVNISGESEATCNYSQRHNFNPGPGCSKPG